MVVEGSDHPLEVQLLAPAGLPLASGGALLAGSPISGLDAAVSVPGTYVVRVIDPTGGSGAVTVSVARTVRVE